MTQRSGLGLQIAGAKESTYGTRVVPTKALAINDEDLKFDPEYFKSNALRAGQMARGHKLHRMTSKGVTGGFNMEWLLEGMGWLFDGLHGNAVTPTTPGGGTLSRKQVHDIGLEAPWGKSYSIQVGRPSIGGVTRPFDYVGCKITEMTIACEAGGAVTLAVTIDGRDEDTGQTLIVASYSANDMPYVFNDVLLKVAGAGLPNAKSITWKITIPQDTDRRNLGSSGLKEQPIANDLVDITADAVLEFDTLADHNRFKNETLFALATEMTGPIIEAAIPYSGKLLAPAAKQVSSGPAVQGPGVVTASASFEILANGTNAPLSVELVNTDTAV